MNTRQILLARKVVNLTMAAVYAALIVGTAWSGEPGFAALFLLVAVIQLGGPLSTLIRRSSQPAGSR